MNQVIMSLKPEYSKLVQSGSKTVELRNRIVRIKPPAALWIYEKCPVSKIVALADVGQVIHGRPDAIWDSFHDQMCIERAQFEEYVGKRNLVSAIVFQKLTILDDPVSIGRIRSVDSRFQPPQFYSYVAPTSGLFATLDALRARCTLRTG